MGDVIQKLFHLPVFLQELLLVFLDASAHLIHALRYGLELVSRL